MPGGVELLGKALVVLGLVLAAIGSLLLLGFRLPPALQWLGRLPGDIIIQRKNFTIYFPIATSVVISIVFTLVMWLLGRKY